MKNILVIGAGRFGSFATIKLHDLGHQIMVIDQDEARINRLMPYASDARIGDSTDESFMKTLGIPSYDLCIVSIGDNFQNSLETTALLSELGAKRVISRASNDVQMKFLLRNGADEVVYPEMQMAMRIATKYASDSILDFIQLDNSYSIYEMKVPREWDGKNLIQLDLRKKYKLNIIAYRHKNQVDIPMPDTVFSAEDVVFVVGSIRDIQKCFHV